jgi:TetR/AcrR family transcriptional repressor of nem operon
MGRTSDAREKLLAVAFDLIYENSYGTVSVEQICRRARVNKGSFYYFFKTKTDLVVAAYEEHWQEKLSEYKHIFAKEVPPLRQLSLWCQYLCRVQRERRKQYGHACGCPYTSLGGELATRDAKVRGISQDLIERHLKFLVGAIDDAQRAGQATPGNARVKAELAHSFVIGLSLRSKIYDDLKVLQHMESGIFALIGAIQ